MKAEYLIYKGKLSHEYLAAFEKIETYVQSRYLDDAAAEDRMGELLDMFLSADEAGKPVEKITGGDLDRFCRTFCSDFGWKNRLLYVVDLFRTVAWYLIVLSAFELLYRLICEKESGIGIQTILDRMNVTLVIVSIAVSCITAAVICITGHSHILRCIPDFLKVLRILSAAASVSVISAAVCLFFVMFFLESTANGDLFVAEWIIIGVSLLYLLIYYPTRGRNIRQNRVSFADLLHETVKRNMPDTMEKKYNRERKHRNGELTLEAFLDSTEHACYLTDRAVNFFYAFPPAVTVLGFFAASFESMTDIAIYVSTMLAVEFILMNRLIREHLLSVKLHRAWTASKRSEIR